MAILKPDSQTSIGGVPVNVYLLTKHNPNRISMPTALMDGKIVGVTIHNTEWISTAAGTTPAEQYTRATGNGNMNTVRVHFYCDHTCAWQNLPLTLSGWHAADGNGNGNRRTIAIECIMSKAYNENDRKSEDNAAKLAAALLKMHGLGIENLYTHTHWLNVRDGKTGTVDYLNTAKHPYKMCPLYILPHWATFKAKVAAYMSASPPEATKTVSQSAPVDDSFKVRIICGELNVRKDAGVSYPITTKVTKGYVYTIVATKKASDGGTWGRLKSGAGWINIGEKYVKRI
jgi:N-acetylmuramoyl-L-alanine amidase CwlA